MKLLTLMQAKEFLTSWFREFQIPGFPDSLTLLLTAWQWSAWEWSAWEWSAWEYP